MNFYIFIFQCTLKNTSLKIRKSIPCNQTRKYTLTFIRDDNFWEMIYICINELYICCSAGPIPYPLLIMLKKIKKKNRFYSMSAGDWSVALSTLEVRWRMTTGEVENPTHLRCHCCLIIL